MPGTISSQIEPAVLQQITVEGVGYEELDYLLEEFGDMEHRGRGRVFTLILTSEAEASSVRQFLRTLRQASLDMIPPPCVH